MGLFAALWMALLAAVILRGGQLPRWLGIFGLVAAAALAVGLVELFGIDLGALISLTVSVVQFWFLAAAIVLLRRGLSGQPAAAPARA